MPNPFTGQPWPWETPAKPADTSARDAAAQSFGDKHGGLMGGAPPTDSKGNVTKGFTRYTAQDGSTVDISDDGSSITNYLPSTQANQAAAAQQPGKTASDVAANAGILFGPGNQVYVKNPTPEDGRGAYIQSSATEAQQQLTNAKTQADTNLANLNAQKQQIDNQIAGDPTNQALKQQQQDLANQLAQANIAKTNLDNQIQSNLAPLNAADVAAKTGLTTAQAQQVIQTTQNNAQLAPLNAADLAAKTGLTNAQAQAALQAMQQNAALAPLTQAHTAAETAQLQVQTQAAQAKMGEPTVLSMGTGPTTTYWDPTQQKMVTQPNPNYEPTDPGRMAMQLKQQMDQKNQQLQQQVSSGTLTPDQAATQWNNWYSSNIEPMKGDIATAQAKAQSALQYQQAQTAYEQFLPQYDVANLANTATNQAQQNALSLMPHLVNANAPQLLQSAMYKNAAGAPQIDAGKAMQAGMFSVPNLQQIGNMGAAQALAHISPSAQAYLNQPFPSAQPPATGLDVNSLLNQNAYTFGAGPTAAQPAAPASGPTPQQLANQNAAGSQITNLGAFGGPMPGAAAAQTYGPLTSNSWWSPTPPTGTPMPYAPPPPGTPAPQPQPMPYSPTPGAPQGVAAAIPLANQARAGGQDLSGYGAGSVPGASPTDIGTYTYPSSIDPTTGLPYGQANLNLPYAPAGYTGPY